MDQEIVHFMRECASDHSENRHVLALVQKPHIAADVEPVSSKCILECSNEDTKPAFSKPRVKSRMASHWYPNILALGVMLIEIELGEGIE